MSTTSPSSGLSPEAKEFVPLVQNPTPSIPLYVDENTVASIYPSDQPPLMIQSIYPVMITNTKVTDNIQFPEIEFHIQPSQQQQFQIDSSANIQQQTQSLPNGGSSPSNASHIVLLPIANPPNNIAIAGYYPEPHIIYPSNEPISTYYPPMDYCEQPLINFSLQQPTSITKSHRMPSQHPRSSSFRQHHGINHTSHRLSSRGGMNRPGGNGHTNVNNNNPNRTNYFDYNNRRNNSSYAQNSGRGNSSNSKRISSSYHQHDFNNYYHSSSRTKGYLTRSSTQYDERRKDQFHDSYNHENDPQQLSQINDDDIPFEFRPEDFPSLPINNQQSEKAPMSSTTSTSTTKPASSWNVVVSTSRPRSTSPHPIPQSQDQRSDRSRSFNNKLSTTNEKKSSNKKSSIQTIATKSPNHASKINSQEHYSQKTIINNSAVVDNENNDDGFIQTKQQHRRLKRKHKIKEDTTPFFDQLSENEETVITCRPDDVHTHSISESMNNELKRNEPNDRNVSDTNAVDNLNFKTSRIHLSDTYDASTQENHHHHHEGNVINSFELKARKTTKAKRSINKEFDDNQKQQESLSRTPIEIQSDEPMIHGETDTNMVNAVEIDHQNSNPLSSSSNNSSDTSDYDDAVDNFDDE